MTRSTFRRVRAVAPVALVAALALASSARPAPAAYAGGAEEVHEIRDVVPFGKDEKHFGHVSEVSSGALTPPSTPLQVRLLASKAPALEEPVTFVMQVHAFKDARQTSLTIRLPEGAEVIDGATEEVVDLDAGQTRQLTITAVLTKIGEQTITAAASADEGEGVIWGDSDSLYLTVDRERGLVGFASDENPELEAVQVSEELAGKPRDIEQDESSDETTGKLASAACCVERDPERGDPLDVSVCWTFPDRTGNSTPLRDARVEIVDRDAVGAPDILAYGFLDYYNGCGHATVWNLDRDEGGEVDLFARVLMEHGGRYRVQNALGIVHSCTTTTRYNVASSMTFGTQLCGGGFGNDGADDIYDDVYRLRRFIQEHRGGRGDVPGECTVRWQADSTDGTRYNFADELVHLLGVDASSRDTTTHECSHRYMHVSYGFTPVLDCPLLHFIQSASTSRCGWLEGLTYITVAGADGNPSFTWPTPAGMIAPTLNLETPHCNSPASAWDDGPMVEGRVGGVLIDLLDPFTNSFGSVNGFSEEFFVPGCFGADNVSSRFGDVWALITDQTDDVFVVQSTLTDSFSKAWQGFSYFGPGTTYYVKGQGAYYCPPDGSCVGGLNSIPTFASD